MKNRLLVTVVTIMLSLNSVFCQENPSNGNTEPADSATVSALPTDIYAGLLLAEPGNDFYSSFGHCAVRLWCPSKKLDFCYTYCLEESLSNKLSLFNGSGKGSYSAIATPQFIKEYESNRRKVECYRLNLTTEQVRELWKVLDGEITDGAYRQYNYLYTNCSSMSILAVERCLGTDEIEWSNLGDAVTGTYRTFVRTISEGRPWPRFVWTTLLGHEGENHGTLEHKLGPTLLPPILKASKLRASDGCVRPLLAEKQPQTLNGGTLERSHTWFSPDVLFVFLFIMSIAAALLEHRNKLRRLVRTYHTLIFTAQTAAGLLFFYVTVLSDMTGASLNLNLLVLNPVPAVMWLTSRRRKWYGKVWIAYTAVLCLYMLMWAVSPQVDFTHILMTLPLLVICLSKTALHNRTTQNNRL